MSPSRRTVLRTSALLATERTHAYLRFLDADRLLHTFHRNVGLSSSATHTILAGLLDAHQLTGNAQALTVLTRMAGWVRWRNGRLTETQRQKFRTNPGRPELFDFHEKALWNHLLGAQNPDSAHGHHSYYVPLRAGGQRTYSNDYNDFTCCHGTGMETNTKHGDSIYFHAGTTLWVNLFVPSVLSWPGRGITVRQDTGFPETGTTRPTVTGSGAIDPRPRVPSWAAGARLRLNGATVPVTPGGYARLDRTWAGGDAVELSLPMVLTREATPDDPGVQAVRHGPIVLAGQYGSTNLAALPTPRPDTIRPTGTPLRYTVHWRVTDVPAPPPFVAHYPFDEGAGTTATGATGGGRTATLAGGAGWTTGFRVYGRALSAAEVAALHTAGT